MANYVITFEGQDKNLSTTISKVNQSLKETNNSTSALDNLKRKFEKVANSTMRATQMGRQFQKILKDGAAAGVAKSDLEVLKQQMARETGEAQRAEKGFKNLTNLYASRTQSIEIASTALQGLSSIASVATSAIALFGDENSETAQKAQQAVNACLTLSVGAQGLASALQGAKAAQLALTRALSTNPYALAIGAVIALGSAIYGLVSKYNSSKNAANSAARQQENYRRISNQAAQDMKTKIGKTVEDTVTKYHQLRLSYIQCKNEHQKRQWIAQYGNDCNKLGLKINGITSAENAFVNNTAKTIESITARAAALGAYNVAAENFGKAAAIMAGSRYKVAHNVKDFTPEESKAVAEHFGFGNSGTKLAEFYQDSANQSKAVSFINAKRSTEGWNKSKKEANVYTEQGNNALKQAIKLTERYGVSVSDMIPGGSSSSRGSSSRGSNRGSNNSRGSTTKEDNGELDSIYNQEQKINDLEDKLNKTQVGSEKWVEFNKQLQEATKHLDELKQKQEEVSGQNKKELVDVYNESKPTSITTLENMKPLSNPKTGNIINNSDIVSSISKERASIQNEIEATLKLINAGVIGEEVGQSYIDGLKDKLNNLPKITKEVTNSFSLSSQSGIDKTADNILDVSKSVDTLASSTKNLNLGDDKLFSGFSAAAALSQTIAQMMIGYGKATAEGASLGPIGWIAFVTTGLAALMSAIATLKSAGTFASGGIIGGGSLHGDNLIARVNSGEMVLNKRQQHNLFNLLDGGGSSVGGGQVKFVIKGTELQGVLNNYNKKINKIK